MESKNKLAMCRLCLCENECLINIFELNDWQSCVAAEVIADLLQFHVSENDGYPNVVCSSCLVKLTDFKQFKERCQNSKVKYDELFASSESQEERHPEMVEFVAVKAEPIFYSDSEDNVPKITGDRGSESEFCEQDPLGETSSHVKLTEAGPSENTGTVQSTAMLTEDSSEATIKQERLDIDSTSVDGSEGPLEGANTEAGIGPIILKHEVVSFHRDNGNGQERSVESEASGSVGAVETASVEDSTQEGIGGRSRAPEKGFKSRVGRFECHHCKKVLARKCSLVVHMATHGVGQCFMCSVCGKAYGREVDLIIHTRTHTGERPYECHKCPAKFSRIGHLNVHLKIHVGSKPFRCTACNMRFGQKAHLKSHMLIHSDTKPFRCDVCSVSFRHKSSLTYHVRTHVGMRPYKCSVCSKAFTRSFALKQHRVVHTIEKPHKCPHCSKVFGYRQSLRAHLNRICEKKS